MSKEYLELDTNKLLEHLEQNCVHSNLYIAKFLQHLKNNQSETIKIAVDEEETKVTQDECLICHESRKVFGANCPYCTEGV